MFWLRCRLIIQARHAGHGDVGGGPGVVFDMQESDSGHAAELFGGRWENGGQSGFLWEEFLSCAVFEWHQGAVNRGVAQAVLKGVNEPFDGVQSGTGISTNHGGGGFSQTGRVTAGVCSDVGASEGSERSQLTFKQACEDHP